MKTPVVNSKVWYQPNARSPGGPVGAMAPAEGGFMRAVVTKVHTPRLVDLTVTDGREVKHSVRMITLLQDADPNPDALVGHCQWTIEQRTGRDMQSIGTGDVGRLEDVLNPKP